MSSDPTNGSVRHDYMKIKISYLSSINICLIGYLAIQGLEDLRNYLLKRTKTLGLIGLVPPHSTSIRPLVCIYENGKQIEVSKAIREKPTKYGRLWAVFYIFDALSVFFAHFE